MHIRAICACLLLLVAAPVTAALTPEQQWLAATEQFEQGQLREAERTLERLLQQEPHFRLARWLQGDLLAARSGKKIKPPVGNGVEIKAQDLADEADLRLRQHRSPPAAGHVPDLLLQPAASAKFVALVDLSAARLHVLENKGGQWQRVRSYFAGIGRKGFGKQSQGDLRTPVGIYRITGFTPDDELPELYGAGSLPLDYPNAWDRSKKRTGSGIWLHGVPRETYVRAPRSSEGCVTLANEEFLSLKPFLTPGRTPVILSEKVNWVAPAALEASRKEFLAQLEAWRQAWSSKNTARYLDYYAPGFVSEDGMNRAQFAAFKQRVNAGKQFIKVSVAEIEAYRYPGEPGLVMTSFKQDYRSDNLAKVSRKQQFWRRGGDGRWSIVSEETL
ncbi:MAG: L,D-transpeptidase family protein [Pseudomonadota bacterium]